MAADEALESELESEFGMFGIDIAGNLDVLEKLVDICKTHKISSDDIVAKWFTYNNKSGQTITTDVLEEFEKKLHAGDKKPLAGKHVKTPRHSNTYTVNTVKNFIAQDDDDMLDDMLGTYATTPNVKESIKRLHTTCITPDEPISNKRVAAINGTPRPVFSPASISPTVISTPSSKYESRSGKGTVICSYGISEKAAISWKGCAKKITISPFPDVNVPTRYKYMFQKLQSKADVLNEMISALSNQMKDNLMLDEYENVTTLTQEDITVSGRICCDAMGRLNSKSILLEGSVDTSGGERIPLDLSDAKNYALFPGQIVALQGRNIDGKKIYPSSIYNGNRLPFYSAAKKDLQINEESFTVYVACGPYATNDTETLSYSPLENLLEVVRAQTPDVVIMLGPFVDIKHPLIQSGKIDFTFDELFSFICNKVTSAIQNLKTEIVFIPSQRDVCHDFVYPQPPFKEESSRRIRMMSDPCTLMINDVCFGMTSTDILFHLGAEEVSSFTIKKDRLGRIADHLLKQQCYYPLYPPSEEINLEYEQFENYAFMPVTPDVLLVPSDLRYFAKDVDGCLCINPGRLVKGQTGGYFVKLLLKPKKCENTNRSTVVDKSIAQIVRI